MDTFFDDDVINSAFVTDTEHTENNNNNNKTAFPDYPEEKPKKSDLITWVETWEEDMNAIGYAPLFRGDTPYECKDLKPRPTIIIPEDTEAGKRLTLETENTRIEHVNEVNKEKLDARLLEMRTRLANKIKKSMRRTAPIQLKKLMAKHKEKDKDGAEIVDAYDGVAMFKELKALSKTSSDEHDEKNYQKLFEKCRDTKLPDNVSPAQLSRRVNGFIVNVNPFLEIKLDGATEPTADSGQRPTTRLQ